jgi:hypothetical protein
MREALLRFGDTTKRRGIGNSFGYSVQSHEACMFRPLHIGLLLRSKSS